MPEDSTEVLAAPEGPATSFLAGGEAKAATPAETCVLYMGGLLLRAFCFLFLPGEGGAEAGGAAAGGLELFSSCTTCKYVGGWSLCIG